MEMDLIREGVKVEMISGFWDHSKIPMTSIGTRGFLSLFQSWILFKHNFGKLLCFHTLTLRGITASSIV